MPCCPHCRGELQRCQQTRRRYIEDIPQDIKPVVTEHVVAPVAAPAVAEKPKAKRFKLTKAEAQELRGMVKSALKGKIRQVDFLKKFMADHPGYKEATVMKIITDLRKEKVFKAEPVVKGNPKAGIYLMPGK